MTGEFTDPVVNTFSMEEVLWKQQTDTAETAQEEIATGL